MGIFFPVYGTRIPGRCGIYGSSKILSIKLCILTFQGNWATDIGGGARFGYSLLSMVLLSSVMAVLFQILCIKLGVVTGYDLAQQCRRTFSQKFNLFLYLLAEVAIMSTDLAEVIGSAFALNLLFGIPYLAGVVITALDVLLILRWWGRKYQKVYEFAVFLLVLIVGVCFIVQLCYTKPSIGGIMLGYLPSGKIFTDSKMLFIAIGILGATVMPHNLYLHASICKYRKICDLPYQARSISLSGILEDEDCKSNILSNSNDKDSQSEIDLENEEASSHPPPSPNRELSSLRLTLRYAILDTVIALFLAFLINSTILIVGASAFHEKGIYDVEEIPDAYRSLKKYVGGFAATCFAIALLVSGQSSTVTGTMAGQIIMSGFLSLKLRPIFRRLLTRLLAIAPAIITILAVGDQGLNYLLVLSQVVLSCQLPFAVIPLVFFTSSEKIMGGKQPSKNFFTRLFCNFDYEDLESSNSFNTQGEQFKNSKTLVIVSVICAVIVSFLNIYLVVQSIF